MAFVEQQAERKQVPRGISDQPVSAMSWSGEFDLKRCRSDHRFSGAVFWLGKNREVSRTEY